MNWEIRILLCRAGCWDKTCIKLFCVIIMIKSGWVGLGWVGCEKRDVLQRRSVELACHLSQARSVVVNLQWLVQSLRWWGDGLCRYAQFIWKGYVWNTNNLKVQIPLVVGVHMVRVRSVQCVNVTWLHLTNMSKND